MIQTKIILVFRRAFDSSYSIEYLFSKLVDTFHKHGLPVKSYILPFFSKGLFGRIGNSFSLLSFSNHIVHITGDTYYSILGTWFSKRLITIHDLSFLDRSTGIARWMLKWFWVILPSKFAHKITVVSTCTKKELLKHVRLPNEKVVVIYNFIDDIFKPAFRNFNSANPKILVVGCSFNKNLERTIMAIEGINCELIIIGKLSMNQESLLKDLKINYINEFDLPLEALHAHYLSADILCFASTIEGFGMPVIEAQATGLPVVTSNCSAMPEVAGNGAVFVNPHNITSLRLGILDIIHNEAKRNSIIKAGYINVNRFSKEKIAADYAQIYYELQQMK